MIHYQYMWFKCFYWKFSSKSTLFYKTKT